MITGFSTGAFPDGGGGGPLSVQSPLDALEANPGLIPLYLLIASPYDPDASATTTIYHATAAFTSAVTDTPASQVFTENHIQIPVSLNDKLTIERGTLSSTSPQAGDIVLSTMNPDDRIDELASYLWDSRDVKVLIGFEGYTLAECSEIFTGTSEGARWDKDSIYLRCRSPRFRLERDIQTNTYAGAVTVTGTDISFTASTTISSTTTDLSVFGAGDVVQVVGSASNDEFFTVSASTATSLTVGGSVTTEAAGASVTIRTSLEGGDELKGRCKPLVYGQVRQYQPVLVNGLFLVWQVHDGSMEAVGAVRDRGVALAFDADYASAQALLSATIPAGEYGTCLAEGYIRLGATPDGIVTVEVQGDNAGSLGDSGYTSTAADIVRKIATTQGALTDPDDLEAGSFDDLNAANSAVVGVSTGTNPEQIAAVLDRVAGSVGAFVGYTRTGRLKVTRLVDPTTATAVRTISVVEQGSFQGQNSDIPAYKVKVGYRRYPQLLSGEEVATSVADATRFDYGQEYRFVEDDDTAAIQAKHPSSVVYAVNTLLDTQADADAEATRLLALYKPSRKTYNLEAWNGLYGFDLGDVVELEVPRYGHDSGINYVVVGFGEAPVRNTEHDNLVALTLWGGN